MALDCFVFAKEGGTGRFVPPCSRCLELDPVGLGAVGDPGSGVGGLDDAAGGS